MTIFSNAGPFVSFGITYTASGFVTQYNEQRGPSMVDLGDGMMDPRAQYNYDPGNSVTSQVFGFWGQQGIVDYIPSAISTNALAAASTGNGPGVALTLTGTGAGITKMSCITAPETGALVTSPVFCIDTACGGSSSAGVTFGSAGTINVWNPASVCGRCITILATAAGDGGNWTVAGRDVYGFKMTESIPAATTLMVSKKAYKYISSVIAATTLASTTILVGTADTYGFPLLVQSPAYATVWLGAVSSATLITVNAGNHAFGSSLAVATSTNGDVRGTIASSVASNGTTMRVTMFISPSVGPGATSPSSVGGLNNITPANFYTMFGATQFSSV